MKDLPRTLTFWTQALDYRLRDAPNGDWLDGDWPDDDWAVLVPVRGEGVQLALSLVASEKARRHHLDLYATDQAAEVERLLALGARRAEWQYPQAPTSWCWKTRTATVSA